MSGTVAQAPHRHVIVGEDQSVGGIDWKELWQYRDLFYFLVWRDIKVRYAQSILGVGWAVIQPVFSMIVFTIVFGNLAEVSSDGVPYAIFSFAALVPWTYFSSALNSASSSLTTASSMLTKVYFPRLVIPLAPTLAKLVDFFIALLLLFGLMAWFGASPTGYVWLLPLFIIILVMTAAGLGMWLTALSVQYRDIQYAMSFGVQLLMYAAPVVYPTSIVPEKYQLFYAMNPLVGVIEGFRAVLLGTRAVPWDFLGIGFAVALFLLVSGAFFFKRLEQRFADVV